LADPGTFSGSPTADRCQRRKFPRILTTHLSGPLSVSGKGCRAASASACSGATPEQALGGALPKQACFAPEFYRPLTLKGEVSERDSLTDVEGHAMRIYGANGTATVANARTARRSGSGTFTVGGEEAPRAASAAAAPRSVGGIDALLALQGLEDAAERRRRGVGRGRRALDALDDLKLALLSGKLDRHAVARLKVVTGELGESTGDPGLDTVLAEIALRAEVELAKIGMPNGNA
jgi:hypothetical protein